MDGYPLGSLDHNVPLIVASGLTSRSTEVELDESLRHDGNLLRSDLPPLDTKEAQMLEEYFGDISEQGTSWTGVSRDEPYRLRVKTASRTYTLPPNKARLPPDAETTGTNAALHSPFSPLSPSSSLYPDGLIDAQWIGKHQEMIPAVYASFYTLTNDPSAASLQDNKLKTDINQIKTAITNAGFKTRLAVVFLQGEGDGSSPQITEKIQDRLEQIRKGTAMDPKSMFYVHPQETPADLRGVAENMLSSMYGIAIEYYRDLARHSRKKRSRGLVPQPTVPPTSGTSQTLSLPDWNFRYDFKTAIFAEFRQEYDPAIRSFEQAYQILLGQDVLDIIPNWSPRWNEARLLADLISIRCLRLHLWMGQPSLAVRRWQAHRDRISDFVDRRGRGTNNYGWQAWEARWALVMAQLIERVEIPGLAPSTMALFLQPEKAVLGDRLHPWEMLHHTGYWYRIAARHIGARRTLALMIPDEDRAVPDDGAGKKKPESHAYDTYLCPPPYQEYPLEGEDGVNHSQLIIDCLIAARTQYQGRKQLRIAAELSLECAREMARLENWQDVLGMLRPLWEDLSFRSEGWVDITEELCWLMRRAAVATGRSDLIIAIDWQLLDKRCSRRSHWHYDMSKSLDGVEASSKPSASISDESCAVITSSFVFRNKDSKAGDTCKAQLCLRSNAMSGSAPIAASSVRVDFEGPLKPIIIEHDANATEAKKAGTASIHAVALKEEFAEESEADLPVTLQGQCDLTLQPGQQLVVELEIPLRESGDVHPSSVIVWCKTSSFDLDYKMLFRETDPASGWFVPGVNRPRQTRTDSRSLHVEPRPPKLEIQVLEPLPQYYADEQIEVLVTLQNDEDESVQVKLDAEIYGKDVPNFHLTSGEQKLFAEAQAKESHISGMPLGSMAKSSCREVKLIIEPAKGPITYEINLKATYHLASDTATPIIQSLPLQLNLVGAFEANYDLVPRLHRDLWPSLFDYEGLEEATGEDGKHAEARGLAQKWVLSCHFASFAQEDIWVDDTELEVTTCVGNAQCQVDKLSKAEADGTRVEPKTMHQAQFELVAQKNHLEDRSPVSVELSFIIRWRREGSQKDGQANTTVMPVGKYLVLGSEPRVLASVLPTGLAETGTLQLDITIENPSNHLLTFGLSMEPSDEFAFSGAKQTTMHLLPMSRRTTTYRLLPLKRGAYIRPGLGVRDKYFQKVLRIIPTEGMKIDKDGLLVWVPGPVDESDAQAADAKDDGEAEA